MRTPAPAERPHGSLHLPSGQVLAWAEYGDRRGMPVLYHHGWPGSRLEAWFAHTTAVSLGLRIIAPDRPGFGASTQCKARTLRDWAADASALVDHLHIDRFATLGISGGAPYALACAAALGHRVVHVCIVSGMGPAHGGTATLDFDPIRRLALRLAARRSPVMRGLLQGAVGPLIAHNAVRFVAAIARGSAAADRMTLARAEVRTAIAASFREGLCRGAAGAARDLELYAAPWAVPLTDIRAPVDLWHGSADAIVPPRLALHLAAQLPTVTTCLLPGEGHYSVPLGHLERILGKVARHLTNASNNDNVSHLE